MQNTTATTRFVALILGTLIAGMSHADTTWTGDGGDVG